MLILIMLGRAERTDPTGLVATKDSATKKHI